MPNYLERLQATILRRKHDAMQPLLSVLSVAELVDHSFCRSMSEELSLGQRSWEVRKATPDLWQQLPETPGLYMFVFIPCLKLRMASPERLLSIPYALYVGCAGCEGSGTLRSRYQTEYRRYVTQDPEYLWDIQNARDRKTLLKKFLNLYPLEYWYLEVQERETIKRLETQLIKVLNPPLNSQGKVRLHPQMTRQAFSR